MKAGDYVGTEYNGMLYVELEPPLFYGEAMIVSKYNVVDGKLVMRGFTRVSYFLKEVEAGGYTKTQYSFPIFEGDQVSGMYRQKK